MTLSSYIKTFGNVCLVLSTAAIVSCNSSSTEQKTENTQEQVVVKPDFAKIIDEMPSPTAVPILLERSGVDFNQTLVNPANKVTNYTVTSEKAALNLGVYSSDLGYLCSYGKSQEAITFFKSSKQLVDKLGVAGAFEAQMMSRFEKNLANKDSLLGLVTASIGLVKQFLNENQQQDIMALTVAGSFVEGLYLATGLVNTFPKDVPAKVKNEVLVDLMRTILEQKKPLADLIKILEGSGSEKAKELLPQFQKLYAQYEALNVEEKIKNNDGSFVLTDAALKEISATAAAIRMAITE